MHCRGRLRVGRVWLEQLLDAGGLCFVGHVPVAVQGLLHRRWPHDLGEFYSTTVFFLLSTFLPAISFIRMDPYGLYMIGDHAGTHLPYLLALRSTLRWPQYRGWLFTCSGNGSIPAFKAGAMPCAVRWQLPWRLLCSHMRP